MIELKLHHVEKLEKLFAKTPKEVPIIMARAINRSADTARAAASQEIRAKYIIRASDVKSAIKINKATASKLSAQVRASGPVIPLMKFDVTPKKPNDASVRARVKKSGSRKPVQHGFIVSAYNNVYVRVGDGRYPIKGAYGPSVAQMMGEDTIIKNIATRAQGTLDKRMEHEMDRLLYGG